MISESCSDILNWIDMKKNEPLTYEQAKDKALRLLTFRAHSEKELASKLRRAGAEDEDIEGILDFCREYKLVNDADFAKRKAADLKNLKKYGKRRIKSELYALGIDSETAEEVLLELEDDTEELARLVERKLGGDFERKSVERCIRYFMYRGYDLYDIKDCIEQCMN